VSVDPILAHQRIMAVVQPKPPHITSFDAGKVALRQPWLTVDELREVREQRVATSMHYILTIFGEIVEEPDTERWMAFVDRAVHRDVARSDVAGSEVVTRFYGFSRKALYESTVNGGWLDGKSMLTSTKTDSILNHGDLIGDCLSINAFARRRGYWLRKQHARAAKVTNLARKRGPKWVLKHYAKLERLNWTLLKIPGLPPFNLEVMLAAARYADTAARSSRLRVVG
jgi:hypothetical protein